VERAETLKPFPGLPERDAEWSLAFSQAVEGWQQAIANGPQVRLEKAGSQVLAGLPFGGNPYNQASPGILAQFAIFSLVTSATIVVQERKSHTMQRLLTTATRRWEIVAGHFLAMFALVFLQQVLLVVFGQLALGVDYLQAPVAVLLVMVGLGLWVSSMGLLIGVIARGDEQVVLFSLIAMFLFSSLGGVWFPLEGTGATYAAIGRVTPAAWAMEGFQNVLIRGLGLGAVLLPAGILLAYALAFFGLAAWRFRVE
jgi:ABC-2 type transport system permease protein